MSIDTHKNEGSIVTPTDIAKRYIQAVQGGDLPALSTLISPNVVWHQPGRNRFSGTHHGLPDVLNMIGEMMKVSQGTFRIEHASSYMANGEWVAIELEFAAERSEMRLRQSGIDFLRIENAQVAEARLFSSDQDAEDTFWGH